MKDIFANIYNKVLNFFHQTEKQSTKNVACNRLKLVLMQDRTNLSPMIMDRMRRELIDLLSKYLELDRELLELNFEQEDEQMALMLSIPVIRAKEEEEIQEILKLEDEAKESQDETSDEENEAEEEGNNEISEDVDTDKSETQSSEKEAKKSEEEVKKIKKEKKEVLIEEPSNEESEDTQQ